MQRTMRWARQGSVGARAGGLAYAGGLAGVLLCALLLMLGGMPAPAEAAGSTICVSPTGDFTTIQAAVDAAQDGDTILLAGDTFTENVVITKSLTIAGRWHDDCSAKNTGPNSATVVSPETGRAFTIRPAQPGVAISVVITDLDAIGDATGLGGAQPIDQSAMVTFSVNDYMEISRTLPIAAAGMVEDWRAQVVQLAAQGVIPGAPTAEEIMTRLAGPKAQAGSPELAEPAAQSAAAYEPAGAAVDCGGAIYATGVSLRLEDLLVGGVGSTTGNGYGGAICIVDPVGGVEFVDSQINSSNASMTGFGAGGAMFVQGGDDAGVTIEDTSFFFNNASPHGPGYGGALAVINTPGLKLTDSGGGCVMSTNLAAAAGNGLGGAVFLQGAADAEVTGCRFFNNYASAGSSANPDDAIPATAGLGGGLYVENSPRIVVEDNKFDFNAAQSAAPQFNRAADGGGAFVANSTQARIANNIFDRNTAGFSGTGFGGGLSIIKGEGYPNAITGTLIYSNVFTQNWATVVNFIGAAGGGLFTYGITNTEVTSNTFTANAANTMGEGGIQIMPAPYGGGLAMRHMFNVQVAGNRFEDNVATVGGGGVGGGLGMRGEQSLPTVGVNIVDNVFVHNLGDSAMKGDAEGGAISVSQGRSITIARNLLIGNSGTLVTEAAPERATTAIMLSGRSDTSAIQNYVGLWDVVVDSNQILNSGQGLSTTVAPPNNFAIGVQAADRFTITNNVIAGSTLGGIVAVYDFYGDGQGGFIDTHGAIVNNTLYNNGTYGLWLLSRWIPEALQISNNIITGHRYGVEGLDLYGPAAPVVLDYTLFYGNEHNLGPWAEADEFIIATHTVAADPLFVAPGVDNFSLLPDSPAINAGDPAGVPPAPPFDIDGGPRPYGPRVDIGAYEWHGQGYPFHFYLPTLTK